MSPESLPLLAVELPCARREIRFLAWRTRTEASARSLVPNATCVIRPHAGRADRDRATVASTCPTPAVRPLGSDAGDRTIFALPNDGVLCSGQRVIGLCRVHPRSIGGGPCWGTWRQVPEASDQLRVASLGHIDRAPSRVGGHSNCWRISNRGRRTSLSYSRRGGRPVRRGCSAIQAAMRSLLHMRPTASSASGRGKSAYA